MSTTRSMTRFAPAGALSAVLVLAGCGGGGPEVVEYAADYPVYRTGQEIAAAADVIVRGTVTGSQVTELLPEISTGGDPATNPQAGLSEEEASQVAPVVVTVSAVRVTEVIKGEVAVGDTVEVSQLGGELGGVRYVDPDTTLLATGAGTDYVLLLADHGPGWPLDLLNPQQALFTVTLGGELVPAGGAERALAVGDLDQLRSMATGG